MRIILWFIYSKYKCIANISYHNPNYKYQFVQKNQFSIFLFIGHELTNVQWQWALWAVYRIHYTKCKYVVEWENWNVKPNWND